MEFWSYYRTFRRRRWVIVGAVLVALAVGAAMSRVGVGEYQAAAAVSIPSEQRAYFIFGGSEQEVGGGDVRIALALSRLRSRDLADRVVRRLNLNIPPEALQRKITFLKDAGTPLVRVVATAETPAGATALANAYAEEASSYDTEVQSRESTLAREFVEKQVGDAQMKLRAAEDALLQFKRQNDIVLATPSDRQVAVLQTQSQATDLSLQEVEARLAGLQTQMASQSATRSDKEITDNPIAAQLRGELVTLEVALASELAVHTENFPAVIAIKAKIKAVKDRLNTELAQIVSTEKVQHNPVYDALAQQRATLDAEKVALLAKKEALARMASVVQQNLPGLAQVQLEQARLGRSVDILAKQYADLQTRLSQARLREQGILDLGAMSVADHARVARPAPLQGKLASLALALLLGAMGGGAVVYALDYVDNSIKTTETAERLLGVPALVAVPSHNPPFLEAYRFLQANLAVRMQAKDREETTIIAVTSPRPRAGTSTVVANLAREFAHVGRRTLLIDAGLHHPVQRSNFELQTETGLAELLMGERTLQQSLVESGVPNLSVLPGGSAPVKLNGLLSSPEFGRLLAGLKWQFDVILIDTPPAGAFADALNIAPLCSGVLLVCDARQAPRGVEERVKAQLERVGAKVIGSVLTHVRPDLVDSYVYQQNVYRAPVRRTSVPALRAAMVGLIVVAALLAAGGAWFAFHAGLSPHKIAGMTSVAAGWISIVTNR